MHVFLYVFLGVVLGGLLVIAAQLYLVVWWYRFYAPSRETLVSKELLERRKEAFHRLSAAEHKEILALEGSAKAESCVWFNAILANLFSDFRAAPFRLAIEESLTSAFDELKESLVGKSLKTIVLKEYGIGNGVPVVTSVKFLSGDTEVTKSRADANTSNGFAVVPSIVVEDDDARGAKGNGRRSVAGSASPPPAEKRHGLWYHGDIVADLVYQGSIHFKIEIETILGLVGVLSVSIAQITGKLLVRLSSENIAQYSVAFLDEPRMNMDMCALLGGKEVTSLARVIDGAVRGVIANRYTLPNVVSYNVCHNPEEGGMTVTADRTRFTDRSAIRLADAVSAPGQGAVAFREAHSWIAYDFPKGVRCIRCSLLIHKLGYYCRDCSYVCHKRCMGRLLASEVRCPVGVDCGDRAQPTSRGPVTAGYTEGGRLNVKIVSASGVASKDVGGTSDPYCIVTIGWQQYRTRHIVKTLDPVWNESFDFEIGQRGPWSMRLTVFDWDKLGRDDYIGAAVLNLKSLVPGVHFRETIPLVPRTGGEESCGLVTVEVMFVERETGANAASTATGVPTSRSMPALSSMVRQSSSNSVLSGNNSIVEVAETDEADGFNMVVVKSGDYAGQTELSMKVRRHEAIDGFLETEEKYVADLERVVKEYCAPLRQRRPADAAAILGNFEEVARATRAMLTFVRETKGRQATWGSVRIGEAFTTGKLGFFDVLAEYCGGRARCQSEYASRVRSDSALRAELRALGLGVPDVPEDSSTPGQKSLTPSSSTSLLKPGLWAALSSQNGSRVNLTASMNSSFSLVDHTAMPERRVSDYSSLLRRVLMMTVPEDPDYVHLADALSRVGEMESVLRSRASVEGQQAGSARLKQLRESLSLSSDEAEVLELDKEERSVVYQGQVRVESGKQLEIVLLDNAVLLITNDDGEEQLFRMPFFLDETVVNGNIIGPDGKEIPSAFALTCDDVHVVLRAENGAVKHKVVGLIVSTAKAFMGTVEMERQSSEMSVGDGQTSERRTSKLMKTLSLDPQAGQAVAQSRRRAVTNPHSVVQTVHDVMSGTKKTREQRKSQAIRNEHQALMSELRVLNAALRDRRSKLKELESGKLSKEPKRKVSSGPEPSFLREEILELSKRQKDISDALDRNMRVLPPSDLLANGSSSPTMPHTPHITSPHVFGPVAPVAENANDQRKFRKTFNFNAKETFSHVFLCILAKSGFGLGTLYICDRLLCFKSKSLFKKTLKIKLSIDDLQNVEEVASSVRLTEVNGTVHVFESFSGAASAHDMYRSVVELWAK